MNQRLAKLLSNNYILGPALALFLIPLFSIPDYVLHIILITLLYAYLCSWWAAISGFGRQVSLGHSAFFGTGAYTVMLLYLYGGVNPWLGALVAIAAGLVLSLVIGYPSFRLGVKGPYFTFATIALPFVFSDLIISARNITGGELGILEPFNGMPLLFQFNSKIPYYYIALAMWLCAILSLRRIQHSRFGYYLFALSQDEDAASAAGINVSSTKLKAFLLSAAMTSLGGVFYTQYFLYINPDSVFGLAVAFLIATTSLVGGARIWFGPTLGAFLVIPVTEYIRVSIGGSFIGAPMLIYGVLIILVARYIPTGISTFLVRRGAKERTSHGKNLDD